MQIYALRPFGKAINILSEIEETGIKLKDTAGNLVDCNYCRVDMALGTVADNAQGYFYVRPALGYASGTLDPSGDGVGSVSDDPGAGVAMAGLQTGTVEIRTAGEETFNEIDIGNVTTEDLDFVITYGYVHNPTGLQSLPNRGS